MAALLDPAFLPFSMALGLLVGLMAMEVLALLVGGTVMGLGGEAELDLDFDAGLESVDGLDLGDGVEFDVGEAPDLDAAAGPGDWLGLSKAPTMVWVAALLLGFGLTGLIVQSVTGAILPAGLTAIAAGVVGVGFARRFASGFARLIPKSESTAMSERALGRRKGVVSQGTAARGNPAEVRVMDGHGNTHYLRAEPLRDEVAIPQGTEVLVMRQAGGKTYRLIPLSDL
ncbi:MAG: OB-fold-containig protein [Pseudomonadota bacterium]